jgi:hypothetical protein
MPTSGLKKVYLFEKVVDIVSYGAYSMGRLKLGVLK